MKVPLPAGFDPDRHSGAVVSKVRQAKGPEWSLANIDTEANVAVFRRHVAETTVTAATKASGSVKAPESFQVSLSAADAKPTMGEKVAATLQDTYPGFYLTDFDPHLARATLTKLDDDTARCRGAVATALGVKPWDVQAAPRPGGGYLLGLPKSYMPSKHDEKLDEVATSVVGQFGWYVVADANKLTAQVIPSDPPTFPPTIRLNLAGLGADLHRTPIGDILPPPGQKKYDTVSIDWRAHAFGLVSGTAGAGKTNTLNSIIADQVAGGAALVIVDEPSKAIDYSWCKKYVRDGGWGCDGLRSAVTALALVYEEGNRRAKVLEQAGVTNWFDLPDDQRFPPILCIVDEVAGLLVGEKLPPGVDRKMPEVQEVIEENRLKFKLQRVITKIAAEKRFVGIRMLLSSQVSNQNSGLPPSLKTLLGQRVLMGPNPSKIQRDQAFSVADRVPTVPDNVANGGMVSKGVGGAELEGQAPVVFKSFFATSGQLDAELASRGVPTTSRPEPTQAEMDEYCPVSEEDLDDEGPAFDPRRDAPETFSDNGEQLFGAAAAAAASRRLEAQAKAQRAAKDAGAGTSGADGPRCPSCRAPIRSDGTCEC